MQTSNSTPTPGDLQLQTEAVGIDQGKRAPTLLTPQSAREENTTENASTAGEVAENQLQAASDSSEWADPDQAQSTSQTSGDEFPAEKRDL